MGIANNDNDNLSVESTSNNPMESLDLPTPLILGSGSFTRKLILKEMNIPYQILVRPIDEENIGDRNGEPSELVLTLAKAKASHLIDGILNHANDAERADVDLRLPEREEGYVVLTADQVVTHDDVILEKPNTVEEARRFVEGYALSPPSTVGSCVLTHIPSLIQVAGVDTATVYFSETVASSRLVERLLEENAPILS